MRSVHPVHRGWLLIVLLQWGCAAPDSSRDAAGSDVLSRDVATTLDGTADAPTLDGAADASTRDSAADASTLDGTVRDAPTLDVLADVTSDTHVADVSVTDASTCGGSDTFVLGTTIPDETNAGVLPCIPRTLYTGPTTITTPGAVFRDLDFDSIITVQAANVSFINCLFRGGAVAPTGDTAMVDCRPAAAHNVTFTRCTFSPRNPSVWTDGIIGHHFTATRCLVEHCVDGFGVYNQFAEEVDTHILGNVVREFAWYSVDPNHTDGSGTHNDGVQQHSGRGLYFIGNAIHGYRWSEGGLETPIPTQNSQIVLTQNTAYFVVSDIHVNNNFIWGGDNGVKFYSARGPSLGGGYTAYAVECLNNTWMNDDQRSYGGTHPTYTIRIDTNITLNGRTYPVGATTDAFGNHYANVPEVAAARRGQPVQVRCDAMPLP